jgi:hypothetical protein
MHVDVSSQSGTCRRDHVTHDSKHGNTAMLQLYIAQAIESQSSAILSKPRGENRPNGAVTPISSSKDSATDVALDNLFTPESVVKAEANSEDKQGVD